MNDYYALINEDMDEILMGIEYEDTIHSLDRKYIEEDHFTGTKEDYGLKDSDFFWIEKNSYFIDPAYQTFREV